MPNHKRPRLLARAAAKVIARHNAAPLPPAVPAEQPADSRTQLTAALDAIAVLDADPAASAVCTWTLSTGPAEAGDLVLSGHLHVASPDADEASRALLAALADAYGGTTTEDTRPLNSGRVAVHARFQVCGVGAEVWAHVQPRIPCGTCGALCPDDSSTAYVSDGTRACPPCAAEIVAEAADAGDQEHDQDDAVEATKATPQPRGGVTSPATSDRAAFVAKWVPVLRDLVAGSDGGWDPLRARVELIARYPSAVMVLADTDAQLLDLLHVLTAEGTLARDDTADHLRWTIAPPPAPVDQDDQDGCASEFVDGSWTFCGCPACAEREDDAHEHAAETGSEVPTW
ncbi:hypothetical protein OG216_25820 [Streptomycetaceae bacterium NBC_01309]